MCKSLKKPFIQMANCHRSGTGQVGEDPNADTIEGEIELKARHQNRWLKKRLMAGNLSRVTNLTK